MANVKGFMRKRGSIERQGFPAQLPTPVREDILFAAKGRGTTRGHSRTFEHKHDAYLHNGKRRCSPQTNAKARTFALLKKTT